MTNEGIDTSLYEQIEKLVEVATGRVVTVAGLRAADGSLDMAGVNSIGYINLMEILAQRFDAYAWEFSRRSVTWSARVVADLRRELALTGDGSEALSTSQYLAHELSKLEIEISLAAALSSFGAEFKNEEPGDTSVAAALLASTDLLHRTVRVAEDMSTELGLEHNAVGTAGWPADAVQAWFGGRRMAGGELARRMGLLSKDARS